LAIIAILDTKDTNENPLKDINSSGVKGKLHISDHEKTN
jgi:hypothetical protein